MDTHGLSIICGGLGEQIEDEDGALVGYSTNEYCLDNLKDIQRFLRRDNPQRREVFKQICKWNVVGRDIAPLVEFHQSERNLVINAVKILVFLTMPIDPASDDVAQQIEYLWDLKAAVSRNVTIAVIVSLLEDPLEHLESGTFTEDDWKLVQLVLTLFRNILGIQGITLQQKASGTATQYLCLTDKFLELMFQENVMDLILVLAQHVDDSCGYLHQDNLLLLEIFHHIFQDRDPELIARASKKGTEAGNDISTSLDALRSIMEEEEERRRVIRQRNLERHSEFSGTFTRLAMDGSKTLFKGNPASASGDGLLKIHNVPRGPLKRIAWDHGSLLLPKENILELLHNFLNQFLSGGYNVLMQTVRDDIRKESQDIQNADVIIFFQVAQFVMAFQRQKVLIMQKQMQDTKSEASMNGDSVDNSLLQGDLCGSIAATVDEAMFYLVISKWREAFEGLKETNDHKSLCAACSLMKNMITMLDLVLKLLPEDSKEPRTARILLYKLFYDQTDQGLTQFLLNLFRSFDTHKQPKSYLADLLEVIHIVLRLMEKLQACGTLRVSKKSRKGRRNKKASREVGGSDRLGDEGPGLPNADEQPNGAEKHTAQLFADAKTNDSPLESSSPQKEDTSTSNQALESAVPLQDAGNHRDDSTHMHTDKENNPNDPTYEAEDSSDSDQLPSTSEVDFDVTKLVSSFANNVVVQNLCWLLKYYKSNSASTNHYIICMLRRFCDDLELSPMLYQLSVLTTFYEILSDQKLSKSKDCANVMQFITKFLRKMMRILKKQPLLFVEILFWKTRKECHCINADAMMSDLANLKKDIKNLDSGTAVLSNLDGRGHKSIADSLGDDEVDNFVPHSLSNHGEEDLSDTIPEDMPKTRRREHKRNNHKSISTDEIAEEKSEGITSDLPTQTISKRREGFKFGPEEETAIRELYEKYRDDQHCNRLIADALDPDGNISPVQVSSKLKQLGLKLPPRKRLRPSSVHIPAGEPTVVGHDESATVATSHVINEAEDSSITKTSRRRKRIHAFSKEQEIEVKELFERFKNEKKCSQLIASAMHADDTYTAAQVTRKLRQLGLLSPPVRKSSKAMKHSRDIEAINEQSDEETLSTIKERSKRKKGKPSMQARGNTSENNTDGETLSSLFNSVHKQQNGSDPLQKSETNAHSAALAENSEAGMDSSTIKDGDLAILHEQEKEKTNDGMMDLEDSGDDFETVVAHRNTGSRRSLKMVIDAEMISD